MVTDCRRVPASAVVEWPEARVPRRLAGSSAEPAGEGDPWLPGDGLGTALVVVGPAPVGSHEVTFRPWGYVQHTLVHHAEAGRDVEVAVVLYHGGDVRLRARDTDGLPLAGAKAEFLDADGRTIPIDRRTNPNNREPHVPLRGQTTSDEEGLVHRQWLPPGPCRARVTLDGFSTAEVAVEVVDEDVVEKDVRLKPAR